MGLLDRLVEFSYPNRARRIFAALLEGGSMGAREIAEKAHFVVGSIYPDLARLEKRGLVTSEWSDLDRRYSLTPQGRQFALQELQKA